MNNIFDAELWARVPFHFWSAVFFVSGCIVGSFLNVCIHRLPLGMSVISPPSHCPKCNYSIPWYFNLPIVTWLWLGGKCANCRQPIPVRYIIIEFITGLAFLFCWLSFGEQSVWLAIAYCILLSGFIVGTATDFEHLIIPDQVTIGGTIAGFVLSFFVPALHGADSAPQSLMYSFIGIVAGAGLLLAVVQFGKLAFGRQQFNIPPGAKIVFSEDSLVLPDREIPYEDIFFRKSDAIKIHTPRLELADRCYWDVEVQVALIQEKLTIGEEELNPANVPYMHLTAEKLTLPREAMGLGDVKLMAAIGAFTGWQGVLFTIFASSLIGSVVGISKKIIHREGWGGRLAFVPYLALAATIWVFFKEDIMQLWFRY